jgi:two-component system, NarL family, invasion response regulator UvrY
MSIPNPLNFLIVDDHVLVREAFTSLLKAQFPGSTVTTTGSCNEALGAIRQNTYHIALVDIELGDRSGLELTQEMRSAPSPPKVVAVSMHQEETFVKRTLQLGARSYVAKDAPPQELFDAIRWTLEGRTYISKVLAQRLANQSVRKTPEKQPHERLSNRELEVLMQLARGKSLKEVATDLSLSPRTVAVHKHNLCRKTGLRGLVDILRYCQVNGLA